MTPFRLGLTGSIGMGKSTTAAMFADLGIPVWDADVVVHRLYAPGGAAALALAAHFPSAVTPEGGIDRQTLRSVLRADPQALDRLNGLVHPLVAADRAQFIAASSADIVVLDIPLLFETGADASCDAVLVVTAAAGVQRDRVLARGLTAAEFDMILQRQMPDAEKRRRADHVIETTDLALTRAAVQTLVTQIRRERLPHA